MKKLCPVLFIFQFFIINGFAQTFIIDKQEVFGVWNAASGPYLIEKEAIIPEDSSLIIEAGTQVLFNTGTNNDYLNPLFDVGFLRINGRLETRGSAQNPVLFSRNGSEGNWGNLYFSDISDSSSTLRYAIIEHASQVIRPKGWMDQTGAVSIHNKDIAIENCRIENNKYDAIYIPDSSPIVTGTILSNNGRDGIRGTNFCNPQIINCTIANNDGVGINTGLNSMAKVINSIMWNNHSSISSNLTSNILCTFSLFEESVLPQGVVNENGNIFGLKPDFADTSNFDFSLRSNSYCINSGRPDTSGLNLAKFDLAGNDRVTHGRIDIGAYEYSLDYLRVVDPNGLESLKINTTYIINWETNVVAVDLFYSTNNGINWETVTTGELNDGVYEWIVPATASTNCRLRIVDAANSSLVDLSDSTFIISDITIISDGLNVSGRWAKEYSPFVIMGEAIVPRDSVLMIDPGVIVRFKVGLIPDYSNEEFDKGMLRVNGTLLAEGTSADTIRFMADSSAGNWGVIYLDADGQETSLLNHVLIRQAGYCDSLTDTIGYYGALSLNSSNVEVMNSRFAANLASALYSSGNSNPQIKSSEIISNGQHGIHIVSADKKPEPLLEDNQISNNQLDGIFIEAILQSTIKNNRIEYNGRNGINNQSGYHKTRIENNFISGNERGISSIGLMEVLGNAIYNNDQGINLDHVDAQIMNNTLVNNSDDGIFCNESSPYVTNCIFSGNANDFDFESQDASKPYVSFSLFRKSFVNPKIEDGGGNRIGQNPQFTGSTEHPFAIMASSPAIDRGTISNPVVTLSDTDLAGNPRIYDGDGNGSSLVDIGAYEFSQLIAIFSADTIVGTKPFTVHFEHQSIGEIDSLIWFFGDGDSSRQENPVHTYNENGLYTVQLNVNGPLGIASSIKEDYIIVEYAPIVQNQISDTTYFEDSGPVFTQYLNNVFIDADTSDTLNFAAKSSLNDVQVSIISDSLFLNSSPDFFGLAQIIVTATDSYKLSVGDTFLVDVKPINDPPEFSVSLPDTIQFRNDQKYELNIWDFISDIDSPDSALVVSHHVQNDSIFVLYNDTTGLMTFTANPVFSGNDFIRLLVEDDSLASIKDSILIIIDPMTDLSFQSEAELPKNYALKQNYPNPFNPVTRIDYQLPVSALVELKVYNILGQVVADLVSEKKPAGHHFIHFEMKDLPSGLYFYRMTTDQFVGVKKMMLIR